MGLLNISRWLALRQKLPHRSDRTPGGPVTQYYQEVLIGGHDRATVRNAKLSDHTPEVRKRHRELSSESWPSSSAILMHAASISLSARRQRRGCYQSA